jgi:hypothetical protein
MSTSTILRPQTASAERRPSHWLTLGVVVYAVAVSVVLVVSLLSGHHHAAKAAPVGAISSQTAEGRAAAEYVPPGLLATPLTAEGRAAAEYVPPGLLATPLTAEGRAAAEYVAPGLLATGSTDLICRRTYLVRAC